MQKIEPQGLYELRISRSVPRKSIRRRVSIKNIARDALIIGLSGALLWHFSNIWRYGQHLIQEPNITILYLETAGLLVIFIFGISNCISGIKREARKGDRNETESNEFDNAFYP